MAASEVIPNPDPSVGTAQAIDKSVSSAFAVLQARLDGMEKAVEVFQADLTRVPTTVDRQILALRELLEARFNGMDKDLKGMHGNLDEREHDIASEITHLHDLMISKIEELAAVTTERFLGVAAQFSERDTRTDQRAGDTKLAVDAAFAAAKEATSKIEMGFTKSIDGQQELMMTTTRATEDKINDLKDRLTTIESRDRSYAVSTIENRAVSSDSRASTNGLIGIGLAAAAILVSVMTYVSHIRP